MGSAVMLERLIITVLIAAALTVSLYLLKRWQKRKANVSVKGLALRGGTPALVYFSSPGCPVCRTIQTPILERLHADICDEQIQWVTIDASAQVDMARQWGITTLPTTCVVDATGHVTHVNNGLVMEKDLRRQLFGDTRIGYVG